MIMKKKIMKRNKKKLIQLIRLSKRLEYELRDTVSLYSAMSLNKQVRRVESKAEIILDFDNAKEFLDERYLVPIKYKLLSGKVKDFGGKRMFKNKEAMEKCQYESNSNRDTI